METVSDQTRDAPLTSSDCEDSAVVSRVNTTGRHHGGVATCSALRARYVDGSHRYRVVEGIYESAVDLLTHADSFAHAHVRKCDVTWSSSSERFSGRGRRRGWHYKEERHSN